MSRLARLLAVFLVFSVVFLFEACGGGGGGSSSSNNNNNNNNNNPTGSAKIVGQLGRPPTSQAIQAAYSSNSSNLSVIEQAVSSVQGVTILLVDAESDAEVAGATSDSYGRFVFSNVPSGRYKLQIEQDEFSQVAYSVDTEHIELADNETVSIGLPVVKRVHLPAYPQATAGSPVALDKDSGRVYMAVDQGLLVLHPLFDTVDLLYAAEGFRSEIGPRLLTYVSQKDKLLIVTATKIWIIDESVFEDDQLSEVINYDDPVTQENLGDKVDSFEVDPEIFIDTDRKDDFNPHYYRFDTTTNGERLYLAAGDQTAVIDWVEKQITRVFLTSGRMAHYSATSNRLYFLREPNTVRIIDADALLEVESHQLTDPQQLLGVSSRPSTGNGYITYTRVNIHSEEVLMLMVVDSDGQILEDGKAANTLGAEDATLQFGVPHWQANGERFIVGDSLFKWVDDHFEPVATGGVNNSSLSASNVRENRFISADVSNAILISYFGPENAAVGIYFLDGMNSDVGIRVVKGVVPVVTLDEIHGRGIVFGDGAMSIIYYNAADAASAEESVDLGDVGAGLMGGAAGMACDSSNPCPDEGVCAPVDEFNTDEGTCIPQVRSPFKNYCGGINQIECNQGYNCELYNPTNPQSAGECKGQGCATQEECPEGYFCEMHIPDCAPDDFDCMKEQQKETGNCVCMDESMCGPPCKDDAQCPDGFVCSASGHCSVDRCLDDESCPDGKVCGVTDQGRACVEPGLAAIGEPCVSSGECESAYCRDRVCVLSCARTGDCPVGEDCMGDEWVGYCASEKCHCGPEEICRHDFCDAGSNCAWDNECELGQICADGRCLQGCSQTSDCAAEEVCVQGPPHITGLYCAPRDKEGGRCWRNDINQPGCPPDMWCSDFGMCMTGDPCHEWDPESCPVDQICIQGACQTTCQSSADCGPDQECTGGSQSYFNPDGQAMLTCQKPSCNCPNQDDICISWETGQLGECWNWSDCTDTGICPQSYRCERSMNDSYRCVCDEPSVCGARCLKDEDCGEFKRCNQESGQCEVDNCETSSDCGEGEVCGFLEWMGRICLPPGSRSAGAPCDHADQCTTGACIWGVGTSPNGTCVNLCVETGDCSGSKICGMSNLPYHLLEQGVLICYDNQNNLKCTDEEIEVEGVCTDKSKCRYGECDWPTHCRQFGPGMEICVCDDSVCHQTCVESSDCNHSLLGCQQGLCRILPTCTNSGDCEASTVCGFVADYEDSGPRCVIPGEVVPGEPCEKHADCMSGFCAQGICAMTCIQSGECQQDEECVATSVGQGEQVLGVCKESSCGCSETEVCNLEGTCGPAPLCGNDLDCSDGNACVDSFCREICQRTDQCEIGEDCVGVSANKPHVCLVANCDCELDQVCDGGVCLDSRPCYDDGACGGGRCLGGQCASTCGSSSQCPAGLECVAMQADPYNPHMKERLCVTPTCHCGDPLDWCLPLGSFKDQNQTPGCYRGNNCPVNGCVEGYHCQGGLHEIANVQGEACLLECEQDSDCPGNAICGQDWERRPICVVPGPNVAGDNCGWAGECRSGICLDGWCLEPCEVTADCEPDQVCGTGLFQDTHLRGILSCYTPENGLKCLAQEWGVEGACTEGDSCSWEGDESCPWPTECRSVDHEGNYVCACATSKCFTGCQQDQDCGSSLWRCVENLCRPLVTCNLDADCGDLEACGLVDGQEGLGLRCVAQGGQAAGEACQTHADCATGICSDGFCIMRCDISGDCEQGEECKATEIGTSAIVVGVCKSESCSCESDQACNLEGQCGPGPLCNQDGDCETGQICLDQFCRATCDRTDQCMQGEDCTGLGANQPHVCLAATCACAGSEICEGGSCFESRPCQDNMDCLGGYCVGGQCYDDCGSTSECATGLECVAVSADPFNPHMKERLCMTPTCNCSDPQEWCRPVGYNDNQDQLPGCYLGNSCPPDCEQGYHCQGGLHDVSNVQGEACYRECAEDTDCPDGAICGKDWEKRPICVIPGQNAPGDNCGWAGECRSGICLDGWCIEPCEVTEDCEEDQVCGTGMLKDTHLRGMLSCYIPDNGLMCLAQEWGVEGACTDGTSCSWEGDESCPWPTECRSVDNEGRHVCACATAKCFTECQQDQDCGSELWGCVENICRSLSACSLDADCGDLEVCGLVDEQEDMGLRCVAQGGYAAGEACQFHADCITGICSEGFCIVRCEVSGECEQGEECQAIEIGASSVAVGACKPESCLCQPDQACNLESMCGPGPICNQDDDCETSQICLEQFCRSTCERTDQCMEGEDCTGLGADQSHVCLPATCDCAGSEICEGGLCLESRPCQDDMECLGGHCIGGQCYDDCTSTQNDCTLGLECVAASNDPNNQQWRVRVCSIPSCDCWDQDSWCLPEIPFGGPSGCFRGDGDPSMCPDCGSDWDCEWVNEVEGVNGRVCSCENLEVCGPHCSSHQDCTNGTLCNDQQACVKHTCETNADCPENTVCGADPQEGHRGRACWLPGEKDDGANCDQHSECASAACVWGPSGGECVRLCNMTDDCYVGEVCTFMQDFQWPHDLTMCVPNASASCTEGCAEDSWCYDGQCHSGTACWYDGNRCADEEICDGRACKLTCDTTQTCTQGEECVLTDFWQDPMVSDAVCKDPECRCTNTEDICRSDMQWDDTTRQCVRPQRCGFMTPCPTGYRCAEELNNTCVCDDTSCGPICESHQDCSRSDICDAESLTCVHVTCLKDSDCPTDTVCARNDNQRFCARKGTKADMELCDSGQWWQCENGMCMGGVCLDPCTENSECAQDQACQVVLNAGQDTNFPFCYAWADQTCGCQEDQFCNPNIDIDPSCQNGLACYCLGGPACSDWQDCPEGQWCDYFSRTCQY